MSHKRVPKRKAATAVGGVVALGAAAILLPNANASQDGATDDAAAAPKTLKATDASDLASQLAGLLGDAFAGSCYAGGTRQFVVNVVPGDNNNVIVRAKRAGATVLEVDNSMTELEAGCRRPGGHSRSAAASRCGRNSSRAGERVASRAVDNDPGARVIPSSDTTDECDPVPCTPSRAGTTATGRLSSGFS